VDLFVHVLVPFFRSAKTENLVSCLDIFGARFTDDEGVFVVIKPLSGGVFLVSNSIHYDACASMYNFM
jgi:hypothetical protein